MCLFIDYWSVVPGQGEYHDPQFIGPEGISRESGYATDIITGIEIMVLGIVLPAAMWGFVVAHQEEGSVDVAVSDPVQFIGPEGISRESGYATDIITDKSLNWIRNRDVDRHASWPPSPLWLGSCSRP
jgi:hypothetical protein